ncbi:ribosome biogenesis GTPase Der [Aquirufa regiilacus]|jgi:GTP-binding protein|uniref:GTPase Der n=1 Tax=Aquirufa regiilacus TaxID=3024868 RepID=A0ABU3TSL8_9BACT|nr:MULTISPECIES: ribosome biogenesis GTPase Der [unclassified Aquirufa]MBP6056138.1 ribosome biogenesis GTPase Der [Cytophagaceae bacterium]MDT8886541.1 ribosome biogenesis GTPase Der [Aquirufa sp. LEPPI-3A]MDU0808871.1 ribosome biogenesis GTPase Der [Aquirufa sp. LEOWEIH-7C]
MSNIVAIVGRPNVGKSTLFNRLIEQKKAIMDNMSGVTRDRHYGYGQWTGKFFSVIDTGGYVHGSEDIFEGAIREQVELAIEESAVLLFVVDCTTGLTDLDKDFANVLRRSKKPVILVANKADTNEKAMAAAEFYELGLGEPYPIAAESGSGTGDMLDVMISHFKDEGIENPEAGVPRVAILGRPNVGKSSFLNALLGRDRSIVTDMAGTTRDAIQNRYTLYGKDFIITDTAGIRRKARIDDNIEYYSVLRSIKALEECDIAIILIDATTIDPLTGLEAQDMNIVSMADKAKKGIVLMVNKWDLVAKDTNTAIQLEKAIKDRMAPLNYMPVIFTSVMEKKRIFQVLEMMLEVYENRSQKISTSKLNDVMLEVIQNYPPPAWKGKYIKIKYCTQVSTPYPTFIFFCNLPQYIKESYERYMENQMRKNFKLEGTPISLFFRKK